MSAVRSQLVCQSLPLCSRRLHSTALLIYTVPVVSVKGSNIRDQNWRAKYLFTRGNQMSFTYWCGKQLPFPGKWQKNNSVPGCTMAVDLY